MRYIPIPMFCLVAVLSVHSDVSRGDSPQPRQHPPRQSDAQKLQGRWRATHETIGGEESGVSVDYDGDELVCVFMDGKVTICRKGRKVAVCEYSLDPNKRSAIDFTGEDLPIMWADGKGIYAVDGDKLRLSFDPVSKRRPKKFCSSLVTTFERKPIDF